jgi:hypothetical protein
MSAKWSKSVGMLEFLGLMEDKFTAKNRMESKRNHKAL